MNGQLGIGALFILSNYFYTFSAWPPLIVGLCSFLLGMIVFVRERGSYPSRTFMALCVCVSVWLLGIGTLYSIRDPNLALGLARVSTAAAIFLPSTLLTFMIVIVGRYDRWKWLARMSLAASAIMAASLLDSDSPLLGLQQFPWGSYPQYSPLSLLFVAYFFGLYAISLVLLYRRTFLQTFLNINRERDRQLWIAFSVGLLASVDFLACYGIQVYPIGYLPVYSSLLILAQTIWKYRFVTPTAAFAAPHIIRILPGGLLVADANGQIVIANERAADYLGKSSPDLEKSTIQAILGDLFLPAELLRLISETGLKDYEIRVTDRQGESRVISFTGALMRTGGQEPPNGFIFILRDVSRRHKAEKEREKAQEELYRANLELEDRVKERTAALTEEIRRREAAEREMQTLAVTDGLTRLYNRRGFLSEAEKLLDLSRRQGRSFLILAADLDNLKPINDTYGHQTGDQVLVQTAELLGRAFRSSDVVARIGGDEFAVAAVEEEDFTEDLLRSRLRIALGALNASSHAPYRVSVSIGIARREPHHSLNLYDLMAEADAALYEQKKRKPVLPAVPSHAPKPLN